MFLKDGGGLFGLGPQDIFTALSDKKISQIESV
jgi:hypothetical protein